ncbi:hypothetical protein FNV43_RR24852 [Rhamnella rubrinervis]|uniref:WAT1-related protein n=1 Tax=Rhamnella rubrinervis TaxID=2594499 RepID=A0A8K0GPI7_9ROSA|nr:hypothetical protein FNV43_RR24852 [Rhamnella rubrinervis]
MAATNQLVQQAKLVVGLVFLQSGYAGMSMIAVFALHQGMSHYILVSYRMLIASAIIVPFAIVLDRKSRPNMTFSILAKTMLLSLLDPVLDQNLYYMGMKYTTATFTSAMCNMIPAFAFLMAWIFRLEKVDIRRINCQAKVLGTILTVGGAMLMSVTKGPALNLPWARPGDRHPSQSDTIGNKQDFVMGTLMITAACFCWSCFMILQAYTLKSYPAALSLTAMICIWGMVEGTLLAFAIEWGDNTVWSIHLDAKLLASLYGGIQSGLAYFVMGVVIKARGPVFYSAFNPLCTVIIAILSSIVMAEEMYLGRVIGASVIFGGLYMVLWGKSKDQALSPSDRVMETTNNQEIASVNENLVASNHEIVSLYP